MPRNVSTQVRTRIYHLGLPLELPVPVGLPLELPGPVRLSLELPVPVQVSCPQI